MAHEMRSFVVPGLDQHAVARVTSLMMSLIWLLMLSGVIPCASL